MCRPLGRAVLPHSRPDSDSWWSDRSQTWQGKTWPSSAVVAAAGRSPAFAAAAGSVGVAPFWPEHPSFDSWGRPCSEGSDPDSIAVPAVVAFADFRPPTVRNRIVAGLIAAAAIDSVGLVADSVVFPVPYGFETSDSFDNPCEIFSFID